MWGMSSLEREQEKEGRLRHTYIHRHSIVSNALSLSLTLSHTDTEGMAKQLWYLTGEVFKREKQGGAEMVKELRTGEGKKRR